MHELQLGGQRVKTVVGEASRICRGAGNSSPTAAGATLSAPPAAIVCFAPRFGPSAPLVSSPSFPRCLPLLREFSPSPFSLRAPRPRSATRWGKAATLPSFPHDRRRNIRMGANRNPLCDLRVRRGAFPLSTKLLHGPRRCCHLSAMAHIRLRRGPASRSHHTPILTPS